MVVGQDSTTFVTTPTMLADLAMTREPETLIGRQRTVVEEAGRHRTSVLGVALYRAPAQPGDQIERTHQRRGGHALTSVSLADVATRDPPVRRRVPSPLVGRTALDSRQLVRLAELTPADASSPSKTSRAARAVPARTRLGLRAWLTAGVVPLPTPSGWKPMHQQPPKMPLFHSTSTAKVVHVDSSRALTVSAEVSTRRSLARVKVVLAEPAGIRRRPPPGARRRSGRATCRFE